MLFKVVWSNRLQVPSNMSPIICCEMCGRVVSMIILWSKIYHSKHHLVATSFCRLNYGFSHCELFWCLFVFFYFIAKKKFVKTICMTLNTVHCGFQAINVSKAEDTPITRTAKSLNVSLVSNLSCIFFYFSCKKLIEGAKLVDIFYFYLIKVNSVDFAETNIHILPEIRRKGTVSHKTRQLTGSSW